MKQNQIIDENKVLYLAGTVGRLMLQYGSEAYRAEESVKKICEHFGLESHTFSLLSSIVTSINNNNKNFYTNIEKVKSRTINLEKISQLSNMIRDLDSYSIDEIAIFVKNMENEKDYPFILTLIGNCLAAGAFAFFFNGGFRDFISSFIGAAFISYIVYFSNKVDINNFFINLIGGTFASFIGFIFFKIGLITNISTTIISILMLLVPGITFTNSIRDLIVGDLVSGIARGVEAFITGTALALGSGITLSILKTFGGI